jgi:uroporphyrinogen-III synthase
LILRTLDNKSGKLLYLSGEFISKDLDVDLIREGYSVDRISNYTSIPIEQIDKKILDFIKKNPPDVFFVYSSKSAKNLFNLINKYSLLNLVTHSNLMCISEKVLLILKQIKWKKIFVFNPGEEEFILNKIKQL